MREIKFRAYDKKKKKWVWDKEPFYLIGETTMFDLLNQFSIDAVNDIVLVQYTGLKDKNGKEIYEGDICIGLVVDSYADMSKVPFSVEFQDGCFIENRNGSNLGYYKNVSYGIGNSLEVIGNIYDNKDLLEDK